MQPTPTLRRLIVVFALVHLVLALVSFATSYTLAMSRFDAAQLLEPSAIERIATGASNVLFQPAVFLLRVFAPGSHSSLVQWFAFACNSLLWGLAVALAFWRLTRRSTGRPASGPPVNLVR